ncbi:MAG TPA: hypothetical protein DCG38_05830, partial [Eubacteriaceae bacterium]|nr:hypothetical protein [Eubacteriaceae bacterium]
MLLEFASEIILTMNNTVGLFVVIRFFDHILERKRISNLIRRFGLLAILVSYITVNIIFDNVLINLLLVFSVNFLIGFLFYQGKKRTKVVMAVFVVIFSFITELITATSFGILFGASILGVRENPMHLLLGGVVSKILLLLLIEIIIRFRSRKASNVSLRSWLLILSIPLVSVVLAIVSVYRPVITNTFDDFGVIACLAIVYINLMAFYLFDHIIVQTDENNQFRFKEEQLLLQQEQYKNIVSGYEQVKSVRHDMLTHLVAINGYLEKVRIEDAQNYIHEIHEDLDLSKQGIISTNVAVDAIINNRASKAKSLGIEIEYDIMIKNKMHINDIDICIILGNALNNAIEA